MFDHIISLGNLFAAWREFRRGKRGKADVQVFERHLEDNLFELHEELWKREYRHGPYQRFHIFDPKHRIIHKATVRDRIVHQAIYRILAPVIERSFIFDSYSCRIGKGTHAAVDRLREFTRKVSRNYQGSCWALKCDISKFFASVDQGILLQLLSRRISDPDTLWLVHEIVESYRTVDKNTEKERAKGLPIGNLTSQLFANFYLDVFDHFMKERLAIRYYLRYTDDFVILHTDSAALVSLVPVVRAFLWDRLALNLHPKKIILRKLRQGIDFLGYVTLPHYRVLRTKTKQRMFKQLGICDGRESARTQSYLGLLSHCNGRCLAQSVQMLYSEAVSG